MKTAIKLVALNPERMLFCVRFDHSSEREALYGAMLNRDEALGTAAAFIYGAEPAPFLSPNLDRLRESCERWKDDEALAALDELSRARDTQPPEGDADE